MERTAQTSTNGIRISAALLLMIACSGCGTPMLYHFKHYHRPFAAVAKSNKTYFHSSQTGRIIEKEPCATYREPGCFGYEPTTWTRWPEQCAGACPVQGEVLVGDQMMMPIEQMPMDYPVEQPLDMSNGVPVTPDAESDLPDADAVYSPSVPTPVAPMRPIPTPPQDTIRVPSIPADVESSIPSPSDATRSAPIRMSKKDRKIAKSNRGEVKSTLPKPKVAHRLALESPGAEKVDDIPRIRKVRPKSMTTRPITTKPYVDRIAGPPSTGVSSRKSATAKQLTPVKVLPTLGSQDGKIVTKPLGSHEGKVIQNPVTAIDKVKTADKPKTGLATKSLNRAKVVAPSKAVAKSVTAKVTEVTKLPGAASTLKIRPEAKPAAPKVKKQIARLPATASPENRAKVSMKEAVKLVPAKKVVVPAKVATISRVPATVPTKKVTGSKAKMKFVTPVKSSLKFAEQPTRRPVRMSAVAEGDTTEVRFR